MPCGRQTPPKWLRESAPGELDKQVPREAAEVGLRRREREREHANRERTHGREIRVVSERDKMLNFIIVVISFAAERFFLLAAVALRFFIPFLLFSVYHCFICIRSECALSCAPHKHNQYAMMWISRLFAPVESARRHRRDQSTFHSTRPKNRTELNRTE